MRKLTILLAFCLSGCYFTDADHFDIEGPLKPYVDKFYNEAVARGKRIQHDNLLAYTTNDLKYKSTAAGQSIPGKIPTIKIAGDLIATGDTLMIQFVVFHELGHALLYRDHMASDDYSIMAPGDYRIQDFKRSDKNRKELIDELFK